MTEGAAAASAKPSVPPEQRGRQPITKFFKVTVKTGNVDAADVAAGAMSVAEGEAVPKVPPALVPASPLALEGSGDLV